jgi:cobalt/nickel transport system permease protein
VTRIRLGAFIAAGLAVAGALAFFVGPEASSKPDGLNRVAIDEGFDRKARAHSLDDLPTAGYAVNGVDDTRLGTGLAGLIGVTVTFALGAGLFLVVRRSRRAPTSDGST